MNTAAHLGVSKTLTLGLGKTFTGLDYKPMYACILLVVRNAVKGIINK